MPGSVMAQVRCRSWPFDGVQRPRSSGIPGRPGIPSSGPTPRRRGRPGRAGPGRARRGGRGGGGTSTRRAAGRRTGWPGASRGPGEEREEQAGEGRGEREAGGVADHRARAGRAWPGPTACPPGYGRFADQRMAAATTWTVTTATSITSAVSSTGEGTPGAHRGQREGDQRRDQQELRQHAGPGGEDRGRVAPGRLSRHSRPRPSRHQALTPKSRAPPDATSPGRIVTLAHGRLPKIATRPGPTREHRTPRRMGTERHTDARSVRRGAEHGARHPTWRVVAALQPGLVARHTPRREVGGYGAQHDRDDDHGHLRGRSREPARTRAVGHPSDEPQGGQRVEEVGEPPVSCTTPHARRRRPRRADREPPVRPRRIASIVQATTCAERGADTQPEHDHQHGAEAVGRAQA